MHSKANEKSYKIYLERLVKVTSIETDKNIHGCPINDKGELTPVDKLLIDPIQYFKQQSRLNR